MSDVADFMMTPVLVMRGKDGEWYLKQWFRFGDKRHLVETSLLPTGQATQYLDGVKVTA